MWHLVLDIRYPMFGIWYLVPIILYFGFKHVVLGIRYVEFGIWYLNDATKCHIECMVEVSGVCFFFPLMFVQFENAMGDCHTHFLSRTCDYLATK